MNDYREVCEKDDCQTEASVRWLPAGSKGEPDPRYLCEQHAVALIALGGFSDREVVRHFLRIDQGTLDLTLPTN